VGVTTKHDNKKQVKHVLKTGLFICFHIAQVQASQITLKYKYENRGIPAN